MISEDNKNKKTFLVHNYEPGGKDVICGRGKKCYNHLGNQILRRIVKSKLEEYSASACKYDKSNILSTIIAQVRMNGGFVKEDSKTGQWYDVGDTMAREKISQTFRDALQDKYKSSTAFKRKRRQEKKARSSFSLSQIESQRVALLQERINQQLYCRQYSSLSQSMTTLDLETSSSEPIGLVERLSSSMPNLSLEEEDPYQPLSISQASANVHNYSGAISDARDDSLEPIKLSDERSKTCSDPIVFSDEEDNICYEPIPLSEKEGNLQFGHVLNDFKKKSRSTQKRTVTDSALYHSPGPIRLA